MTQLNPSPTLPNLHCDVVIVGAGIAGLWLLNRLKQAGYSALLLESQAIGAGQTLKSQGIIHGGLKYALNGILSSASEAISQMPSRWQAALQNQGELPLGQVKVHAQSQCLFSVGGLRSQLLSFFASKALKSRVQKLEQIQYPEIFKTPAFKGHVYQLQEWVLDVQSLLTTLSAPHLDCILKVDEDNGWTPRLADADQNGVAKILALDCRHQEQNVQIVAQQYVFTAGSGNQLLCRHQTQALKTQERPLHMVWGIFPKDAHSEALRLFGHCLDQSTQPRLTITSHQTQAGELLWYLGGELAETGVSRNTEAQIAFAQQECARLFPWIDFSRVRWGSLRINRAEPQQANGQRPDSAQIQIIGNMLLAWPSKLALAPVLADQVLAHLRSQISPTPNLNQALKTTRASLQWPSAPMGSMPWDNP